MSAADGEAWRALTARRLLETVQHRGSDAKDLRDAAHEAAHALQWKVRGKWTRDAIHRKKPRQRAEGVYDEITARAVEQLVCADLGEKVWTVDEAARVCWMETFKNEGILLPAGSWLADTIRERMKSGTARRLADQVLALGRRKPPEPTK